MCQYDLLMDQWELRVLTASGSVLRVFGAIQSFKSTCLHAIRCGTISTWVKASSLALD